MDAKYNNLRRKPSYFLLRDIDPAAERLTACNQPASLAPEHKFFGVKYSAANVQHNDLMEMFRRGMNAEERLVSDAGRLTEKNTYEDELSVTKGAAMMSFTDAFYKNIDSLAEEPKFGFINAVKDEKNRVKEVVFLMVSDAKGRNGVPQEAYVYFLKANRNGFFNLETDGEFAKLQFVVKQVHGEGNAEIRIDLQFENGELIIHDNMLGQMFSSFCEIAEYRVCLEDGYVPSDVIADRGRLARYCSEKKWVKEQEF